MDAHAAEDNAQRPAAGGHGADGPSDGGGDVAAEVEWYEKKNWSPTQMDRYKDAQRKCMGAPFPVVLSDKVGRCKG